MSATATKTYNNQIKEKKEFTVEEAVAKCEAQEGEYPFDVCNFYSTFELPYGVFSNFWPCPFIVEGVLYRTSEHYFQALKFKPTDKEAFDAVVACENCMDVTKIGRDRTRKLRPDWESVKIDVMYDALTAKYLTYPNTLLKILLSTGKSQLVERTKNDSFWGSGADDNSGTGGNWLGKLLVRLRDQVKDIDAEKRSLIVKTLNERGVNLLREQPKAATAAATTTTTTDGKLKE